MKDEFKIFRSVVAAVVWKIDRQGRVHCAVIGVCAATARDGPTRVGRFRSEHLDSDFLWQLLRSEPYLNQLAANEKGMDIPHLSKEEILEPIVPLIPEGEQILISSILKSIDEQSQSLLTRRTQIQSLKKSLMQDLLTGKVRVTVN